MQNTPVSSSENPSSQSSSLDNIEYHNPKHVPVDTENQSILAENYYNEGKYSEALKENEILAELLTKIAQTQPVIRDLSKTFYRIGIILLKQAQYTRCFEYLNKAKESLRVVLSENIDENKEIYINILEALAEFHISQDQYQEALDYANQAMAMITERKGDSHKETASNFNIRGRILLLQGEYTSAIQAISKARDILQTAQSPPELAKTFYNLATVYNILSQYEKAEENSRHSLEIYCQCYGPRHPEAAFVYDMLGNVNLNKGYFDKALTYYRRSLKIRNLFLDKLHPNLASSYENLGIIFYKKGDYQQALEYHNKSLEMRKSFYTENHLDIASSYNNIGALYYEQGSYMLALENFEKSLNIRLKCHGQDHIEVASSYNNLGNVYESLGDYTKAIECQNKSLSIRKKCFGENHIEVSTSYNNLAAIYHLMGQRKDAFENYMRSIQVLEASTSEKNKGVGIRYFNLGLLASENLDNDLALNCFLKANKTSTSERRGIQFYSSNQIIRIQQAKAEYNTNTDDCI